MDKSKIFKFSDNLHYYMHAKKSHLNTSENLQLFTATRFDEGTDKFIYVDSKTGEVRELNDSEKDVIAENLCDLILYLFARYVQLDISEKG